MPVYDCVCATLPPSFIGGVSIVFPLLIPISRWKKGKCYSSCSYFIYLFVVFSFPVITRRAAGDWDLRVVDVIATGHNAIVIFEVR